MKLPGPDHPITITANPKLLLCDEISLGLAPIIVGEVIAKHFSSQALIESSGILQEEGIADVMQMMTPMMAGTAPRRRFMIGCTSASLTGCAER